MTGGRRRVFQRHGHAMKRAQCLAASRRFGGRLRGFQGLVMPDEAEAVQFWVNVLDARQGIGHHFDRRHGTRSDHPCQVDRRRESEFEVCHPGVEQSVVVMANNIGTAWPWVTL